MSFERAFGIDLGHGRCAGVLIPPGEGAAGVPEVPGPVLAQLHPDERDHAAGLSPGRRPGWVAGRLALRAALADLGGDTGSILAGAILVNDRGAPALPQEVAGSISHKATLAVAWATPPGWAVGIDLELVTPQRYDLGNRILGPAEQERLLAVPEERRAWEVLWAFSAKEAIYKAIDPFVRRRVGFHEVEVTRAADGRGDVASHLTGGEGPFDIELVWVVRDAWIITAARVRRRHPPSASP